MRYLAEHETRLGTAAKLVRTYASDRNAFRYMHQHLADGLFPAGQYRLYRWPEGAGGEAILIGHLYKAVARQALANFTVAS